MKRHTTKPRRHSRQSVLEVRVISRRIVWFGLLKLAARVGKLACLLALLGGAGWGGRYLLQKAFFHNPDFRLQVIALNANPAIDELGVAAAAGIDLTASPNLFTIDFKEVARKLRQLPELADARVERHLPGTLAVTVTPRLPKAWITCPAAGLSESRRAGALLVDEDGIAYPCPPRLVESSATLPIIELSGSGQAPIAAGAKIQQPELEHCLLLLDAARDADPAALQWIESVRQVNAWSLLLVTRQGTAATFGLGDRARQMESLRAALEHAGTKGYLIASINLIPKYNIPITLRAEPTPPPRAIPVPAKEALKPGDNRRARDLETLLKRN